MRRALPILVVVILAAIAGLAWAISSPLGSSPDEDFHLASIWCPPPVESSGCVVGTDSQGHSTVAVQARIIGAAACYAFHPNISGSCTWSLPATEVMDGRFDRNEYPGGYYHVMHLFTGQDPYVSVFLMRATNIAIALAMGTGVVLAAARPARRILAYTVASTYVPMGMFIIPSLNPSSWAVTGVTAAAFAMHSYWLAETRGRVIANGALAVAGVALAASARTDAALYVVLAAAALAVLHYRQVRRHLLRLVVPLGALIVAAIVFRTSSQGSGALAGGIGTGSSAGGWQLLAANVLNLPYIVMGNQGLGPLGWLDTPMPPIVYVATIMVWAFLLVAAMSRLALVKSIVGAAGIVLLMVLPLYILQVSHISVGESLQPRYILPLLPVVSLVALTGRRPEQAIRLSLPLAWLTWALVSGANSVALMVNIRRYTTGMDGPMTPGQSIEWWTRGAPGPMATWLLGSLAFAVCALMVVRLSTGSDTLMAATSGGARSRDGDGDGDGRLALALPVPALPGDLVVAPAVEEPTVPQLPDSKSPTPA